MYLFIIFIFDEVEINNSLQLILVIILLNVFSRVFNNRLVTNKYEANYKHVFR